MALLTRTLAESIVPFRLVRQIHPVQSIPFALYVYQAFVSNKEDSLLDRPCGTVILGN